jgi:CubicO group peptidase (beta-lactamase class C family)
MRSPAWLVGGLLGAAVLSALGRAPVEAQAVADSTARRIDAVFAKFDRPDAPGCALGVYRSGRTVYARGYGSANLELRVPIGPTTVFDIGSTSKQFTAMSVLLLARDAALTLDDDVRRWIPELPSYGAPITIRHLLHHTSGLRDYLTLMELGGERFENVSTDDDALAAIVRQRALNFRPGSEWQYSNTGFFLLSVIVKRASGMTLSRFAAERIFRPLGMTHTHIHDDHRMIVPDRATGYDPPDSAGAFRIDMSNFEQTGDGSVMTTVEDLLRWDENFYAGTVGGPAVLAEMVKAGTLADGTALDYAAGLFLGSHRGLRTVAHGGSWAGYRAELLRFPTEHASVAVLCNVGGSNPEGLAIQVADVWLAGRFREPAGTASAGDGAGHGAIVPSPAGIAGTYRDAGLGAIARVVSRDGRLRLLFSGADLELRPTAANELELVDADARLQFTPAAPPGPRRIAISGAGLGRRTYDAIAPLSPAPAALAPLAGDYWSEELQAGYRIAVEQDSLVLHARGLPAGALLPTVRDEFEYPPAGLTVRFLRGRGGRIAGFTLAAGRTQGLRFVRRPTSSPARPPGR